MVFIILSEVVEGNDLRTVLGNGKIDVELNLDSQFLSEQNLMAMLINPEDGKPNNFILSPGLLATTEKKRNKFHQ